MSNVSTTEEKKQKTSSVVLRFLLFLCMVALWLVADQYSKWYATEHWKNEEPQMFLNNMFCIEYALNTGGFLSLGGNLSQMARYIIFIVMNSILILGATIYLVCNPLLAARYYWSIGLIVAGGIGNLIDRIRFEGKVVDFMILRWGSWHTGIFNVADVAITTGVIAIFIFQMLESDPAQEADVGSSKKLNDIEVTL